MVSKKKMGNTDMELGKNVVISDWEWGRNSASRKRQKIPGFHFQGKYCLTLHVTHLSAEDSHVISSLVLLFKAAKNFNL